MQEWYKGVQMAIQKGKESLDDKPFWPEISHEFFDVETTISKPMEVDDLEMKMFKTRASSKI